MHIARTILLTIVSILMGSLFLYSAFTKVSPIQTFEYTLVEFVHMPWWMAAIGSRLLIGLETAIGAMMILNMYGFRKWVLRLSLLILAVFSIYLIYLWAAVGNDVNCGCFGDQVFMSPSTSLLKNAVMIIVTFILLKYHNGLQQKWANYVNIIGFVVVAALPYFLYYIPSSEPSYLKEDSYDLDLSAIYESEEQAPPALDIRKGKHIVAFMSLTCPHCKIAAYKMQLMKKDNPDISMFMVLNGDSTALAPFWEKTKAQDIPYIILLGRDFTSLSGFRLPAIYWVNDSRVEAKSTYLDLNQAKIEAWMKEEGNITE